MKKENFNNYDWIEDKKIEYGCSKKRPDLFLDYGSHVIIIEIDELQHKGYNCETVRVGNLWEDINWKPLVIIRFNPDTYINKNRIKIKSPWGITEKRGLLKIINNEEWNKRLQRLKKYVKYWLENDPQNKIELIYLYYDSVENNNNDENLKSIK